MKATFELAIRDEDGNIVGQLDPYQVNLGNQTLHEIEGQLVAGFVPSVNLSGSL